MRLQFTDCVRIGEDLRLTAVPIESGAAGAKRLSRSRMFTGIVQDVGRVWRSSG
jgi:hypothetical protein